MCIRDRLHAEDVAAIHHATSTEGTAQERQRLGEKLASDRCV